MEKYRMYNTSSGKAFPSDSLEVLLGLYYSLVRDYVNLNNKDVLNNHVHNNVIQVLKGGEYVDYDYIHD